MYFDFILICHPCKTMSSCKNRPQNKCMPRVESDGDMCIGNDDSEEDEKEMIDGHAKNIDSITYIKEMCDMMPEMGTFLETTDRKNSWVNLIDAIKTNKLPADNIALHLFLEIVDWYGHTTVHAMRYSAQVKRWWAIGYRLFRERFLHFMGSMKNTGQVRQGKKKGNLTSEGSVCNFIAPSVQILREEMKKTETI